MGARETEIDALADRLRPHYRRFLDPLGDQILLTGHSHQAWPDVAREGQIAAWDDAARLIDGKWSRIFGEILPEYQRQVASRIGSQRPEDVAIAASTHELVCRFASAFPERSSILATDSEFHSLERQLSRWSEDGARIRRVPVEDGRHSADTFAERFIEAARNDRPTWAALSYVLFTTSRLISGLPEILAELARLSIPVVVDAYHAFNVIELETELWEGDVFVVGGGYKYAQCGEGVAWMLLPEGASKLRPRNTGWFSHFETLQEPRSAGSSTPVAYGSGGLRFVGATFDPTSLYRAVYVLRFMDRMGLTPRVLRAQSLAQTGLIIDAFDALGLAGHAIRLETPRDARGGFIALGTPRAHTLCEALASTGVRTDVRGRLLRLGPAPYLGSEPIARAMRALASLASRP